nr:uncharacterized protein CI109_006093 [Kwoniella shandongensis]KAA5525520.1 hypothetical protein CI109_006093 [Kwoniella shandongensis]
MSDDLSRLEYAEEDDLFGTEVEQGAQCTPDVVPLPTINPSVPIQSSSTTLRPTSSTQTRTPLYPAISQPPRSAHRDAESRLMELRQKRIARDVEEPLERGVRSLKSLCMTVIKANSPRIWDIGDLEYSLIKPFVDELPMEQLVEIEANSPHIKKDTDWLYEIYLLQDHPLFHERCRERQGEPRTSGWRRMYRKAKEDAIERQHHAADRVAARYKQLEEEKAAKRIVVMDKIMPDKKPTSRGGSGWGRPKSGGSGSSSGALGPKPANAIAKARVEAQRARVALTHASGRYIPPPPSTKRTGESELFKNPYLPPTSSSTSYHTSSPNPWAPAGPRIPPPRTISRQTPRAAINVDRGSSPSSPKSPIPGAFPTSQTAHYRAALPNHLSDRQTITKSEQGKKEEGRFRIEGDGRPKKQFKEIRKPEVVNFEAPKLQKEKPHAKVDFFGGASKTVASSPTAKVGEKRKLGTDPDDESNGEKRAANGMNSPNISRLTQSPASLAMQSAVAGRKEANLSGSTSQPKLMTTDESAKLNSIMFRKRKPIKGK